MALLLLNGAQGASKYIFMKFATDNLVMDPTEIQSPHPKTRIMTLNQLWLHNFQVVLFMLPVRIVSTI